MKVTGIFQLLLMLLLAIVKVQLSLPDQVANVQPSIALHQNGKLLASTLFLPVGFKSDEYFDDMAYVVTKNFNFIETYPMKTPLTWEITSCNCKKFLDQNIENQIPSPNGATTTTTTTHPPATTTTTAFGHVSEDYNITEDFGSGEFENTTEDMNLSEMLPLRTVRGLRAQRNTFESGNVINNSNEFQSFNLNEPDDLFWMGSSSLINIIMRFSTLKPVSYTLAWFTIDNEVEKDCRCVKGVLTTLLIESFVIRLALNKTHRYEEEVKKKSNISSSALFMFDFSANIEQRSNAVNVLSFDMFERRCIRDLSLPEITYWYITNAESYMSLHHSALLFYPLYDTDHYNKIKRTSRVYSFLPKIEQTQLICVAVYANTVKVYFFKDWQAYLKIIPLLSNNLDSDLNTYYFNNTIYVKEEISQAGVNVYSILAFFMVICLLFSVTFFGYMYYKNTSKIFRRGSEYNVTPVNDDTQL